MTRAERRREEREWALPSKLGKTKHLRQVTWTIATPLADAVREIARSHRLSETETAEMLIGAGIEVYREQQQKEAEKERMVTLVPGSALTKLPKSPGARLGGTA